MKTALARLFTCGLILPGFILLTVGCRGTGTESNININTNVSNANVATANTNVATAPISALAAKEPERYKATLVFTAETEGGEKTVGIPPISAEVARNGEDRRVSFKLPDGSDLIYLDHAGIPYAISLGRKQYAELTKEATGFQLHKLMTPGQLVSYLDKLKGIEPAGEDTVNGRTALKYRYAKTATTSTAAGTVNTESFIFIDKETGLPLRTEILSEASGNVQGVKGAKIIAEMRDITTDVDPKLFEVPPGLNKVPEEQVRAQINALIGTVGAIFKTILANMNTAAPAASPALSPAASPSPTQ
ncbi:MAG TPA: hypothetical protein VLA93_05985 [Pyrinomonadaceae bacterium]|nr:hypothetical protein [Pyrinomonadaceae bacterium]